MTSKIKRWRSHRAREASCVASLQSHNLCDDLSVFCICLFVLLHFCICKLISDLSVFVFVILFLSICGFLFLYLQPKRWYFCICFCIYHFIFCLFVLLCIWPCICIYICLFSRLVSITLNNKKGVLNNQFVDLLIFFSTLCQ